MKGHLVITGQDFVADPGTGAVVQRGKVPAKVTGARDARYRQQRWLDRTSGDSVEWGHVGGGLWHGDDHGCDHVLALFADGWHASAAMDDDTMAEADLDDDMAAVYRHVRGVLAAAIDDARANGTADTVVAVTYVT